MSSVRLESVSKHFGDVVAVDAIDLDHVAVRWLTTGCARSNAWCHGADMNHSGIVSLMDFVIFASFWMNDPDTIAD